MTSPAGRHPGEPGDAPVWRRASGAGTEARKHPQAVTEAYSATRDDAAMGRLAERLVWTAWDLAVMVREQDRDAIGGFLDNLTEQERHALPVVLAALVDPEKPLTDALSWVTWTERGYPLRKPRVLTPRWRVASVPCETAEALRRHDRLGEECGPCEVAETVRKRAREARRAERDEEAA